jgi:hypothetical protein
MRAANREIGVPGFQTQIPASTSESGYREVTFSPYRRLSLNPARAPAVWVVLLQLEAELRVSAERQPEQQLAVFQIDAGDKCPRLLWMAARILRLGSAEREDCASGPPVAAFAVAEFAVVAAADAAELAAEAAAVATVDAVAVVFAAEAAAAEAAGIAVAPVVAAVAAAVAFVVALAVLARRPAGKTSLAAECY